VKQEETKMPDTSVKKVNSEYSPKGQIGQKYLASGKTVSMRLWQDGVMRIDCNYLIR